MIATGLRPVLKRVDAHSVLRALLRCAFGLAIFSLGAARALGLAGDIFIHDPSTVVLCDGHYYVFGTGPGIPMLSSSDGFTWQRGGRVFDRIPESVRSYVPKNNGRDVWAPDIIHIGDRFFLYYAISSWGQYVSAVGLMTSPTLDPERPDYKWTDRGMVVHSVAGENLNAIDPGVCRGPGGDLWLSYGSYHGAIQLVQLDPRTGLRIAPNSQVWIIASQSEASDIIYHDGYYYLFVNHGSCCNGANSTYNIRVGRARNVTGPYWDRDGDDLAHGGGSLFLAAQGRRIGPGHFGLLVEDGVEKFSCHYEADLDHPGRSVLSIQPLLWTPDGWPVAGENVKDGTYQLRSERTGNTLEAATTTGAAEGTVRLARYVIRGSQKWTITAVGGGFYKIVCTAGGQALAAAPSGEAVGEAAFTGADSQLWKIDQLSDGSYRIASKSGGRALTAVTQGRPGNRVDVESFKGGDTQRWAIATP
jgi:arabinan endo-1,5-alpha-L-arabinosidase